jgi:hypothetical protein
MKKIPLKPLEWLNLKLALLDLFIGCSVVPFGKITFRR